MVKSLQAALRALKNWLLMSGQKGLQDSQARRSRKGWYHGQGIGRRRFLSSKRPVWVLTTGSIRATHTGHFRRLYRLRYARKRLLKLNARSYASWGSRFNQVNRNDEDRMKNNPEQCICGQGKTPGHKCNAVKCIECYSCDYRYGYTEKDIYTSCDLIDAQYTEFEVTQCPNCKCENRL